MKGFHAAFAHALLAAEPGADGPLRELAAHPAFAVYRNTVMKGCIDALEANFPAVATLVGGEWFRSAAAAFVRARLPEDGRLLAYGDAAFPDYLRALPSAAGLPYLAGVARLDALWRAAHAAADAPVLPPGALAPHGAEALARCVLLPHPAAQWAWFEEAPVAGIWSRAREGRADAQPPAWTGDGLLFVRPGGAVRPHPLSRGGCALLEACRRRASLGEAVQAALEAEPAIDLSGTVALLLRAGAFTESLPTPGDPA